MSATTSVKSFAAGFGSRIQGVLSAAGRLARGGRADKVKLGAWLGGGVLAVWLGVWAFGSLFGAVSGGIDEDGVVVAKRGDLKITLTERGTFKAKNSARVRAQIKGGAKIESIVDEGTRVKEGDIVVELDKTEARNKLEQLQNQVVQYESELKSAETEQTIQEDQNKTDIETAALSLEVAQVSLTKLIEGEIPQAEQQYAFAIEKAESDRKRAEHRVKTDEKLLEEEFVTQDQYEQDKIALKTAINALASAKMDQKLYLEYQKPLDLKQARAAVEEATRGVERARKRAEARLEACNAKVRQNSISLEVARERLSEQQELIAEMTLRANASGMLLYGNPDRSWRDDDEIKVGAQVWQNMILATIPDTSEMSVTVEVHEAEIEKVKVGMPAILTSETVRGRFFDGEIVKIDSVANAGSRWRGDVKKFKVEVAVTGDDLNLRPGTSAQVEIQIGEATDVISVPVQAVHAQQGRFFCYLDRSGEIVPASVELGRSNDTHVEVVSGIDEGDRVLLYDPELPGLSRPDSKQPPKAGSKKRGKGKSDGGRSKGGRSRGGKGGGRKGPPQS